MKGAMNGHKPKAVVLDRPRARRDAARVLAVALQTRIRRLYDAQISNDENQIVVATADLAQCMYENIEFVIWALKSQGGMNPPPPDTLKPISQHAVNIPMPVATCSDCGGTHDPDIRCPNHHAGLAPAAMECTCPPLEHGILFRERHMTSCPKYVP